jgi:hypothetical protein
MVSETQFDQNEVLKEWDFKAEQAKADFLESLFHMYKPEDRTYTGLWQRFIGDLGKIVREEFANDPEGLLAIFRDEK